MQRWSQTISQRTDPRRTGCRGGVVARDSGIHQWWLDMSTRTGSSVGSHFPNSPRAVLAVAAMTRATGAATPRRGVGTPETRSTSPKNSRRDRFLAPSRYVAPGTPLSIAAANAAACIKVRRPHVRAIPHIDQQQPCTDSRHSSIRRMQEEQAGIHCSMLRAKDCSRLGEPSSRPTVSLTSTKESPPLGTSGILRPSRSATDLQELSLLSPATHTPSSTTGLDRGLPSFRCEQHQGLL